jgi:uncharacterized protein (TIGR01244 family)
MDIRYLSPDYAVSPQIEPRDVARLKEAGFTTVICNRPDEEIPEALHAEALRAAVEGAGMTFVVNPIAKGGMSEENIAAQTAAMAGAAGPVFAYCASGNRSSIVWALTQAGRQSADALIGAAAQHGYQLEPLRPMIEARAASKGA